MPLNDADIRALTYLATRCRPHGAPHWDEAGIFAAIDKVRQLNIADVALSVIRAADDEKAKTPGVIANTSAPNWQERRADRPQPREPYDRNTFCEHSGRPMDKCAGGHDAGPCMTAAEWGARLRELPPKPRLPRVKDREDESA